MAMRAVCLAAINLVAALVEHVRDVVSGCPWPQMERVATRRIVAAVQDMAVT
jgi:hypothetical protein